MRCGGSRAGGDGDSDGAVQGATNNVGVARWVWVELQGSAKKIKVSTCHYKF